MVPSGWQDEARIALLSFETGQWKVLFQGGSVARYMHTGHVVYASGGSLLAAPFDVERLEVTGPARPVLEDVRMVVGAGMGSAHFDVSLTGCLAYIPGYPRPSSGPWSGSIARVRPSLRRNSVGRTGSPACRPTVRGSR